MAAKSLQNGYGSAAPLSCDLFASDGLGMVEIASTASEQLRLQQAALETTANAVVITDPEGKILWTNPAFTTLTGYPIAEALGQTPRMLKSGQHDDSFYQALWKTLRSGSTWRGEVTNRRRDGSLYQGEQVITPIPGGGKGITHFIAVMNDLTARKQAEAELRTKAAQLGQLLDHSPVVLYMLRVHGDLLVPTIVSENVTPLLGFTMTETLCVGWWDEQVHPDDRAVAGAALQRARSTGEGTAEYRIRHKDGSYRVVEDKIRLVRAADGKSADLIGVWTDITERKRAEETLGAAVARDRRQQQAWHRWLMAATAALGVSAAVILFLSERAGAPGALGLLVACVGLLFYWQTKGARNEAMHERRVQNALRALRDELETRVQQRTAELAKAYEASRLEISERARAERELERSKRALHESEALYHSLVEQLPAGVYRKDAAGRYVFVNTWFARLVGLQPADYVGRTAAEMSEKLSAQVPLSEETRAGVSAYGQSNDQHDRIMKTGERIELEESLSRPDGRSSSLQLVKAPVLDAAGVIVGSQGIVFDITARKNAEKQLLEQREQWRALVSASTNAVFVVQEDTLVLVNPAAGALFGAAPDGLIGRKVFEFIPEVFHPVIRRRMQLAQQEDSPLPLLESMLRRLDGALIEAESSSVKIHFEGAPAFLVEARDITERKRAETARQEADARFRQLTENIREVFWLTNLSKNEILYVSPGYEKIWGRSCASLVESPRAWLEAIHPDDRDRIMSAAEGMAAGTYDEEYRISRPDGSLRWIRDRAFPVRSESGAIHRIAGLAEDITERKRVNDVLQESERRFRDMLANVDLIAMTLDREGRVTFCNDFLLQLTGWQRDEVINTDWFSRFVPEPAGVREIYVSELKANMIRAHFENPIMTRSGERREIVWNNTILRAAGGNVVGTASIGEDVTDRNRAVAALRKAKEQYQSIFQHAMEGIYQSTPEGTFLAVNPAMARILGFHSPEELVADRGEGGRGGYVDPEQRAAFKARIEQQGFVTGFESEVFRRDGDRVWISENARAVRGGDGKLVCYEGSIVDITERKRAEMRLKLQHAVTQVLADGGSLERTNQRALETIGRAQQWEYGELWMVDRSANVLRCAETWHLPSSRLDTFASARRQMTFGRGRDLPGRVWASGGAEWIPEPCGTSGEECLTLQSLGVRSWVGFPVKLRDDVLGVVGFFCGQTGEPDVQTISTVAALGSQLAQFIERHQLAEQFREAQKMEAIGTLAGGIAHDFNNIIAAIVGYTELAKMELSEKSKARRHLEEVLVGSTRAAALVRQILAFSRQQDHERKPIQLRPIVREAMSLLRATIPATIEFDFQFERDLPPVLADATQVHQVVMNLGTNAWHAMKDRPGRLGVKIEAFQVDGVVAEQHPGLRAGGYVRLSVSDTGHGMDRATLSRVFEPFFTTKGPGEGTGLGLAVVHGIMQTHEGAATVYSQLGEGTVFRLYFPTAVSESAAVPDDELQIPRGHGERILYVDDELPLAAMGGKMLERLGYVVDVRTNPHDAIAAVRAQPDCYALVITDLAMPEMKGTQLAQELLSVRSTLPIVLITGYTASLTPARVQAMGIRELLSKPISMHVIGTAVARILARPKHP